MTESFHSRIQNHKKIQLIKQLKSKNKQTAVRSTFLLFIIKMPQKAAITKGLPAA
jgi:hypothetical protein